MKPLLFAALLALGSAQALSGQLGYLTAQGASVETLSSGKVVLLPQSRGAQFLALSPRDGTAVYFVALGPGDAFSQNPSSLRGFISAAPYRVARPLPAPFQKLDAYALEWARDGSYFQIGEYRFDPRLNRAWKTSEAEVRSASSSGRVSAWVQSAEPSGSVLRVVGGASGSPQAVFDPQKLAPWNARFGNDPQDEPSQDPQNWWIGAPAVSPDGQAVYFTVNGGQSGGAAGNTSYRYFKYEPQTRRIVDLERFNRAGSDGLDGRLPRLHVSPDGKKLLSWGSFHVSALENPSFFERLDLAIGTRKSLDWVSFDPRSRDKKAQLTNWVSGACWLSDSRTVAISGALFDVSAFYNDVAGGFDAVKQPRYPQDFALYLIDSQTGALLRRIPGAASPSCR